jgi:hypothetical protein
MIAPTISPTITPSGQPTPGKNVPSLKLQPTSKPTVAPSPALSASPTYSVSPTFNPSSPTPTVSHEPTSMPSTSPPTISFAPSLETVTEPSAEPSVAPAVPEPRSPPANITSFVQTSAKKFSFEAGPLAGFVIGCVVFGGLSVLLFYYCIMPSVGLTGVGKNTVAPSNQQEKNILI